MARRSAPPLGRAGTRPGARWQPVVGRRLNQRVAGRTQLRLPRVQAPSLTMTARWRRAGALALVLAGVMLFGWWVYRSPLLTVQEVSVKGNQVLSAEAIQSVADVKGSSIIRPDFEAARQRLLALPLVKDAQVGRDWPNGARITVMERAPWGVWQAGQQRYVVDDEGVVLDPDGRSLPAPEGTPVIVQTDAAQATLSAGDGVDAGAVAVARQLVATAEQTLGRPVVGLEFSQSVGLTVVLAGDLRAVFGDAQDYEFKVATLSAVLAQAQANGQQVHRVDLRFGDRVAVE